MDDMPPKDGDIVAMTTPQLLNYLRIELINRFVDPMIKTRMPRAFIATVMAEAAGRLCPREKDVERMRNLVNEGYEKTRKDIARAAKEGPPN
jgi:hypothetical protein